MKIAKVAIVATSVCAVFAATLPATQAAEEETAGNNLSIPLLWTEAAFPPPITIPVTEKFEGAVESGYVVARDTTSEPCEGALQKDFDNVWQADTALAEGNAISTVDWGDNIESMDPNLSRAYTRVEVGLYSNLETPANGYEMCWISGRGQNEVWGAQVTGGMGNRMPVITERTEAAVYTAGARLTIQRIVPDRNYNWNAATHRWEGTGADAPYYSGALHEGAADGPGSFGAEVTVSGKLSYGYLWDAASVPQGEYRLTLSLDGAEGEFPGSGTNLATASILASEEETSEDMMSARAEGSGNTAVMRGDINVTYIDVTVGTRTDPIPTDDTNVTPPPSGGETSTGSTTTTAPGANSPVNPPLGAGPMNPEVVVGPASPVTKMKQQARIRAAKSGTYKVGQTLLLTPRPIYTDAGVTVRWRERVQDRDECRVVKNKGRVTLKLIDTGKCTVIGWAPAPSDDYAPYQWKRTYRIVR